MKKIDHIAICVSSPKQAADWYIKNHGAIEIFADDTWAIVQFENVKLAFVVKEQHPPHFAFEVDEIGEGNLHRDGSISVYKNDPWGNVYELVKYPELED